MAKYKHYDYSQGKFIPISFDKQILPGTFDFKARKLTQWVKVNYPETWMSLPWILRKIVKADIGLRRLHRAQLIDNALFTEEYNALQKYDRHIWLSLFCSLALLVLVLAV